MKGEMLSVFLVFCFCKLVNVFCPFLCFPSGLVLEIHFRVRIFVLAVLLWFCVFGGVLPTCLFIFLAFGARTGFIKILFMSGFPFWGSFSLS